MAKAKDVQTNVTANVNTNVNTNTIETVENAETVQVTTGGDVIATLTGSTQYTPVTPVAPVADVSPATGPSYNELLDIVRNLSAQVQQLQAQSTSMNFAAINNNTSSQILDMLANRKSDKEVIIVHNCELVGGLTTHIELTGITIDFTKLGEQRVLGWQQFEECVSKYHNFFERQIILLSDEHADLSARYGVPCVNRGNNHIVKREELMKIDKLSCIELENYINTLTPADKDLVFSYWLGKAYDKENYPTYYDRSKLEVLNRLSPNRAFDNILTYMNGDSRVLPENTQNPKRI